MIKDFKEKVKDFLYDVEKESNILLGLIMTKGAEKIRMISQNIKSTNNLEDKDGS